MILKLNKSITPVKILDTVRYTITKKNIERRNKNIKIKEKVKQTNYIYRKVVTMISNDSADFSCEYLFKKLIHNWRNLIRWFIKSFLLPIGTATKMKCLTKQLTTWESKKLSSQLFLRRNFNLLSSLYNI